MLQEVSTLRSDDKRNVRVLPCYKPSTSNNICVNGRFHVGRQLTGIGGFATGVVPQLLSHETRGRPQ